ncbi:MAG: amino acid permease [Gemmatimonadales bacterium]|nr:amino acid permease [Gemmatimonadales bacterium]MYG48498.1 amino acid permease [Gemmatimonadales bacterium]MYK02385.1 amino acid permease [Candidatus Palauibacter ramosifaciens]
MSERHMGLYGATALGVGAIVGGGILALAGVAFATAGPAAMLAFALNGGIAFLTAMSFARLARRFPESGGIYTYAKKVLSIEVAFIVGWVVWFASIVAGVLYALGFAAFLVEGLERLAPALGVSSDWFGHGGMQIGLAIAAVAGYSLLLVQRTAGGGNAATIGKVVVFAVLIAGGVVAWFAGSAGSPAETLGRLSPFAPQGSLGLLQAMGYTFIALQGFDLIAAVGGEVRDSERTVPRAMYLSLGIALVVYIPLLVVVATVGAPPEGIQAAAEAHPEELVAVAAERFMGPAGYWLVIGAGLLSMLSALHANLFGASRVAFAMARDRTLPHHVGEMRARTGTPAVAVAATGAMMMVIAVAVGNVAAAGAASSLIFLISFAMVHWAAMLARLRSGHPRPAALPVVGAALCLGLAIFQAIAVPEAGRVVAVWLGLGALFYLTFLAPGARLADASAQARDPDLARLRGRSPLILVPIANPASAASLADVAATVRAPGVGQVLLLSVIPRDGRPAVSFDAVVQDAKDILGESVRRGLEGSVRPEALFTTASDVWGEIARVANGHRCDTVLLGLTRLTRPRVEAHLEGLISKIDADVVIVRAPPGWRIAETRRVLVSVRGRRDHSELRARLLGSLARTSEPWITFLRTLPSDTPPDGRRRVERGIRRLARDEAAGPHEVAFEYTDEPVEPVARLGQESDLVVMGMERRGRGEPGIGAFALEVARRTDMPLILLGRRRRGGTLAARGLAQAVSTIQRPGQRSEP